jgi:hypothetical protein
MGSDLYCSIERQYPNGYWSPLWCGRSHALARGIVVDAFGACDYNGEQGLIPRLNGYLTHAEQKEMAEKNYDCPWDEEAYWVRQLSGAEFVRIIRDKDWQKLQDGNFHDVECNPQLRSFAALVESLLAENVPVRVWCWHSQ